LNAQRLARAGQLDESRSAGADSERRGVLDDLVDPFSKRRRFETELDRRERGATRHELEQRVGQELDVLGERGLIRDEAPEIGDSSRVLARIVPVYGHARIMANGRDFPNASRTRLLEKHRRFVIDAATSTRRLRRSISCSGAMFAPNT
jgi:hypothetical protein